MEKIADLMPNIVYFTSKLGGDFGLMAEKWGQGGAKNGTILNMDISLSINKIQQSK